jgi:DHA3 family macrolide efflux protein-like MFS transporter
MHSIAFAILMMGVCTVLLGVILNFWYYSLIMALFGMVIPLLSASTIVLLQEKVPEDYLGRVFGVETMIATAMMPLGMVLFGPLADLVRIEWLLLVSGLLLFIVTLVMFNDKQLLKSGEPKEDDQ